MNDKKFYRHMNQINSANQMNPVNNLLIGKMNNLNAMQTINSITALPEGGLLKEFLKMQCKNIININNNDSQNVNENNNKPSDTVSEDSNEIHIPRNRKKAKVSNEEIDHDLDQKNDN
jgi:hypothetical protein